MKRLAFIAIFIIGLINFSSCRSTSNPCGLAKNVIKMTKQLQQGFMLEISTEMV